METVAAESRYWIALHASDALVVLGDAEAKAAHALRVGSKEKTDSEELFASYHLLLVEIHDREARYQAETIIGAGLKFIPVDLGCIVRPLSRQDADALIARFGSGSGAQRRDLAALLGLHSITFSDEAWAWLARLALESDEELQRLAYIALTEADAKRFGRELLNRDWSWSKEKEFLVNHCGSGALIEATTELPFDQVAPRLAPWRLLEATRRRGCDPAEVRFAATVFGRMLAAEKLEPPDPGSDISADCGGEHSALS